MKYLYTLMPLLVTLTTVTQQSSYTTTCFFSVTLADNDYVYADTVALSIDHPAINLEKYTTSIEPIEVYDTLFKENKLVYTQSFALTITLSIHTYPYDNAHLYLRYYQKSQKKFIEHFLPLTVKPPETYLTTIAIENNTPIQRLQRTHKPLPLPTWSEDVYAILLFLLSEYSELIIIWWILIGLFLCMTPLISPMLALTSTVLLDAERNRSLLEKIFYSIIHICCIYTSCTFVLYITAHIQAHPLWYLHATYSCTLIAVAIYLLKWHIWCITFLEKKNILTACKYVSAFILLTCAQVFCVYPIAYYITNNNDIHYALYTILITVSAPFYLVLIRKNNQTFFTTLKQWSKETIIALGYMCIYATVIIWYYTDTITAATGISLSGLIVLCNGVWYIMHANTLELFWSYFTRIVGIILCASSLLFGFYWYKLQHPIKKEKALQKVVLKK